MGSWTDERSGVLYEWPDRVPEVDITDNPVVASLLGPDGSVLRQWTARPVPGFVA